MSQVVEFLNGLNFVKDITAGDELGWVIAAVGAITAFTFIQRMQLKIERHGLLYSIENELKELFSKEDIATKLKKYPVDPNKSFENINLRTVLGEEWIYDNNKGKDDQISYNGQRYWKILSKDDDTYYLSSQAFQDSLSWFRRVKKLYKDGIIKTIDLADLWRQILPYGSNGRLSYFKKYFKEDKDIESIVFILIETLVSCNKHKMNYAVKSLLDGMTEEDKKILSQNNKFQRLERKYCD